MDNTVLYRHLKPNGEVFYIGIGSIKRAYSRNRTQWWKNIVGKYGYEVQILKSDLSWNDAVELEKILISHYGRLIDFSGKLCNLTLGGEGVPGCKNALGHRFSESQKIKMSETRKGRIQSQEWINKRSKCFLKEVYQYSISGDFISKWESAKQIGLELGISPSGVSATCRGKYPKFKGFKWSYKEL